MAEEKVNEFEHGDDQPVMDHSKSFQQLYGPEANYSYRAESAEEILEDPAKLRAMIRDHYESQCPRLAALDNYIKARNDNIYSGSRRVEKEKSDHRAAHNFAKIINVFDVGYNTGIPIKKRSDSEEVNRMIDEYDQRNDIEALDSELWRDFRKYGRAYELQYRNQNDEERSVISNVFETFVCYGLDVERTPLFAVRYPRYWNNRWEEQTQVFVYTEQEVITYKPTTIAELKLTEEDRKPHSWGEVPITEYSPDRYRQGGYEDVIPLIDLYDAAQSDTANYMSDLNDATLVISGGLNLGKYSVKDMIDMKRANILLLSNGINPDGSKSQTDARYIYKQYDVTGTEAYKERLQKDIHKISFVPDLTDESFSGTQSGEAMKYKLFGFQQVSKTSQRGFAKGLTRRYRLLLNIKRQVQEADNTDLGNFKITFTPNLPKAIMDELKVLVDAGMDVSQETLMELASFIDDVKTEKERIEKEESEKKESSGTSDLTRLFGTDGNGTGGDGDGTENRTEE